MSDNQQFILLESDVQSQIDIGSCITIYLYSFVNLPCCLSVPALVGGVQSNLEKKILDKKKLSDSD